MLQNNKSSSSISIPIYSLPKLIATTPVVPEPLNGSKIKSPFSELEAIILLNLKHFSNPLDF